MSENKNSYILSDTNFKRPLSKEEQNKYLLLASQGNYEAQTKIFEHNLRLVIQVINGYSNFDCDKEDLFQTGCEGLWKAIQNFDISQGVEFSTYAVAVITGKLKNMYFRDHKSLIKIPRSIENLFYKINNLKKEYNSKGIELDNKQIAILLNVTEQEVSEAIRSQEHIVSLSSDVFENNNGDTKDIESIIQDPVMDIEEQLIKKEIYKDVRDSIDKLDEKKSKIIKLLFGIGCERKTQKEVAKELNVSPSRISEIYRKTIKGLAMLIPQSTRDEIVDHKKPSNGSSQKRN